MDMEDIERFMKSGDPFEMLEALGGLGQVFNRSVWKPHNKSVTILNRAMEHINSVDYGVSIRWVFYRLLQEGLYNSKSGYINLVQLTSKARHNRYDGWSPNTLVDETREIVPFYSEGDNEPNIEDWDDFIERIYKRTMERKIELENELKDFKCTYSHEIDPIYYQR